MYFLRAFSGHMYILILNVYKINCEAHNWSFVRFVFLILGLDYLSKPKCANQSRIFIVNTLFNVYLFVIKCNIRHIDYYTITNCTNRFGPGCIQWVLYTYTYVSIYIRKLKRHSSRIHGCDEIHTYKLV